MIPIRRVAVGLTFLQVYHPVISMNRILKTSPEDNKSGWYLL